MTPLPRTDDQKRVECMVAQWSQLLGLERWDITVCWETDVDDIGTGIDDWSDFDKAHARVWRARDYDIARVYFNPESLLYPERRIELLVIHELLHLLFQPLERIISTIRDSRGFTPDMENLIEKQYDHDVEGVIDRLAYRLREIAVAPPRLPV